MATGKKLAKSRTRTSVGQPAARTGTQRKRVPTPAAMEPQPAEPQAAAAQTAVAQGGSAKDMVDASVSPVVSASQDPAPDAIIHLGAHLTIREAVPLRAELLERVDAVDPVGLDASGVQKVDTAGLQVLLAFTDQRRRAGNHVAWTGCSESLRKAAALLAMEAALGLPAAGATA